MPLSTKPLPGQRWVSDTEPELGLGIILKEAFGRVEVLYPAAGEHRQYAMESAPLRRVQYAVGDKIKLHEGEELLVETVEDREGLLIYHAPGREVAEAELSDTISFSKPEDRLLGGQTDDLETFDLRAEALVWRSRMRQSPVRGFTGARIDLIPHQMFIAGEVSSRLLPRVLLADEVGLGKTIEACLVMHRLHLTGRAERVLILVPEPLIHQWFVELLRRFNLLFSIFDEERCESIELHNPEANPFLDSQLVIASVSFLAGNPQRASQAVEAGWDLLIVDEAHHLEWTAEQPSDQYRLVESLAACVPGILLLTATPQQLGPEGHFARLRLLDPDRYAVLERFLEESGHYAEVAATVDRLLEGKDLSKKEQQLFGEKSGRVRQHAAELAAGDQAARQELVSALLDEFGTGRVMFRNTRAALSGFPERKAMLTPLAPVGSPLSVKIKWLAGLLRELKQAKVLLICRTRKMAEQIDDALRGEINVKSALFHEELTLLQRDRNAAFFAEDDGARVLICSEIGSEGRNFQFAHHLVLFDLPEDPELLEQRIGRLDRIGQKALIRIHVPYMADSEEEVLARWYHEGLNAFEKNLHGASELLRVLQKELGALRKKPDAKKLHAFIAKSQKHRAAVAKKLEKGHDRLLELGSSRPEQAAEMIQQIRDLDADLDFEAFVIRTLDHFGVHVEELSSRTYLLAPGQLRTDAFPAIPEEGMMVTFDRTRALSREDLGFMSWDHPVVRGALDLLLGSESGNSAFGIWKNAGKEAVLLEIHAVVESVAPAALHVDRFLPATPVRVVVDHALTDQTEDAAVAEAELEKGDIFRLLDRAVIKKKHLPAMLAKAEALAKEKMAGIVAAAASRMDAQLKEELTRLTDLRQINDHVRPQEITALEQQQQSLQSAIAEAHLRMDSLRLIFKVP